MSTLHYLQLACEQPKCPTRFPAEPMPHAVKGVRAATDTEAVAGVPVLRVMAAEQGWETKVHTKGRDLCPPCRIAEIQRQYGWAFEEARA